MAWAKRRTGLYLAVAAVFIAIGIAGFGAVSLFQTSGSIINIDPESLPEKAGFETYVGDDFYLYYPEEWKREKITSKYSAVEIGLVSPTEEEDEFAESMLVTSDSLGTYSMKDYATISLLRLQTEIIPGFFLEDAGPRKVGNIDGFQAIFTGNDNKNPVIKYMQVYVPAGRKIFVLTYTSWNSTYESGLAEASGIIDSFTPFNSQ